MRCVGYVRKVSGCIGIQPMKNAVRTQKKVIKAFAKRYGWEISDWFIDNSNDPQTEEAFAEMRNAGIRHKYDCVLVYASSYCGKNYTSFRDLFSLCLYPAGIQFAVVKDDFYSGNVGSEAVSEYFQQAIARDRSARGIELAQKLSTRKGYLQYGYVGVDGARMEIDIAAAEIIRSVFDAFYDGSAIPEIVDDLNERNIETPQHYRYRMLGWDYTKLKNRWTKRKVKRLLETPEYGGIWTGNSQYMGYESTCPAMIDPEKYQAVQEKLEELPGKKKQVSHKECPVLSGVLVDKETEWPLTGYTHPSKKIPIFRFRYPGPRVQGYAAYWISVESVEDEVKRQIEMEHDLAGRILEKLENGDAESILEQRLKPIREKALPVFSQMAAVEQAQTALSVLQKKGDMDEEAFIQKRTEYLEKLRELDCVIQGYFTEMDDIKRIFSKNNPWLQTYAHVSLSSQLTRKEVRQYVERVEVFQFTQVSIVPKELTWKKKLPQKWME